jgi:general secretion pathway protein A
LAYGSSNMYLSYYHLKEEPFRLTPDPKFLQLAEPHREALTRLVQGVVERRGLMVLSGPVGTGKTTILNGVLNVLSRRESLHPLPTALLVNPRLTRDELLEMLLFEFQVSCVSTSRPARLAALQELLFTTFTKGGTCLLIVDEAHLLSEDLLEEVRLLMNTESYREKLLQVVLCGQPELTHLLNAPKVLALRQRIADRAVLRALSQSEMRMYIRERLRVAGFEQPVPFTTSSLDKIFACTGGVPRLINVVCDTCLLIGSETNRTEIGDDIVEESAARHELPMGIDHAVGIGLDLRSNRTQVEVAPPELLARSIAAKATGQGEL